MITEEDMRYYDVTLEDFFTKSENAMEFLHEVMRMAGDEVGYKPDGPLTSLQIAPGEENGMTIYLSENSKFDPSVIIKQIKKSLGNVISDEIMDKVENATAEEQANFISKLIDNVTKEIAGKNNDGKKKGKRQEDPDVIDLKNLDFQLFSFPGIKEVMDYASMLKPPADLESTLYKDTADGSYYLAIWRGDHTVDDISPVYMTAYEFGRFVSDRKDDLHKIRSHSECVVDTMALPKLSGTLDEA